VVEGAGKGFCGGDDLVGCAEQQIEHPCQQKAHPWDPLEDYAVMKRNTEDFMSLWRSAKPTIAMMHDAAVAGASDIALCCDLLVMADEACIGYMPTRQGLPDHGHVDLPPGPVACQAAYVHWRRDRQPHGITRHHPEGDEARALIREMERRK
jgi:enoyl-CoA hydratase/carnithine racemase